MARLWSCGFELNSTTAGVEFDITTSAVTIQTSVVRSGTYAAQVNSLSSGVRKGVQFVISSSNTNGPYYLRAYFRYATLPSAENRIIWFYNGISQSIAYITIDNSGVLRLYDEDGQIGSESSALSADTWYRIELLVDASPAAGSHVVTGRIDGTNFASASDRSLSTGVFTFNVGGNLGAEAQTTGDWYFDDLAFNDSTGSDQTSWPGDGKIVHLRPSAAGDNNTWQKSDSSPGTSTNYQNTDEVTPDDGTTHNLRDTTTIKVDDYNVDSSASAGINSTDTISLVHVGVRGGSNSASAAAARDVVLRIKSAASGTVTKGPTTSNRLNTTTYVTNTTLTPRRYYLTSYTDPDTSSAWTPTGTNSLDNMQIGVENQTSITTPVRITTLWALVEYVPDAGGGTAVKDIIGSGIIPFAR